MDNAILEKFYKSILRFLQPLTTEEVLDHLATHNPNYESFEPGLIEDIVALSYNPNAILYLAVAGETASGKTTLVKH